MKTTLSVGKRSILIIFLILISVSLTSCELDIPAENSYTPEVWEFKLITCSVEERNVTNGFGGVIRTDKYLKYAFQDGDEVIFKEKEMKDTYDHINYRLKFEVTDGEAKIIQENGRDQIIFTFQLTQEMYDRIFAS